MTFICNSAIKPNMPKIISETNVKITGSRNYEYDMIHTEYFSYFPQQHTHRISATVYDYKTIDLLTMVLLLRCWRMDTVELLRMMLLCPPQGLVVYSLRSFHGLLVLLLHFFGSHLTSTSDSFLMHLLVSTGVVCLEVVIDCNIWHRHSSPKQR